MEHNTLVERIDFAMRYVRGNQRDLFFMSGSVTDDMMFRTALAAVMVAGSEDDKDRIERSLKPVNALNAAFAGVAIDPAGLMPPDDFIPLLKMWHDSAKPPAPAPAPADEEPDFLAGSTACALKPGEGECEACQ